MIFSFRAECAADVVGFLEESQNADIAFKPIKVIRKEPLPDVYMEIETDADLAMLCDVMRLVVNGHVMIETLRQCPLASNALERHGML